MNDIYAKCLELINRWENCQSDRIHEFEYISLDDFKDAYDRFYDYCEKLAINNNRPLCDYIQAVAKTDNYYIVEFNNIPQGTKAVFEFDDVDNYGSLKVTTYETKDDFTEIRHYIVLDGEYDS